MAVAQRMTADRFLATTFDERRVELIDGEVVVNEPRLHHGLVGAELIFRRSAANATTFDVAHEISGSQVLKSPLLPGFAVAVERSFAG